jgi:hypothetical protein
MLFFDYNDIDLGVLLPDPPLKKKRPVQKCICGGKSIGLKDFMAGHYPWCEVHEDKTPCMRPD